MKNFNSLYASNNKTFRKEAKFHALNLNIFCRFLLGSTRANKHTHMHTVCLQVLLTHAHTPPDSSWTECPWLCALPYGLAGRERDWPPLVGEWRGGATVNKSLAGSSPALDATSLFPEKQHRIVSDFKQMYQTLASRPAFGSGIVCPERGMRKSLLAYNKWSINIRNPGRHCWYFCTGTRKGTDRCHHDSSGFLLFIVFVKGKWWNLDSKNVNKNRPIIYFFRLNSACCHMKWHHVVIQLFLISLYILAPLCM